LNGDWAVNDMAGIRQKFIRKNLFSV